MSNRYCTAEFFRAAARVLSGDGVLVLSLSTYGAGHEYLSSALARRSGSIWRALAEVFPEVHAAPVNGHLLAAAKRSGTFSFRPAALGERLAARPQAQPKLIVQAGAQREETPVPPADYFDSLFGNALAVQMSLDAGERQTNVEDLEHALVAAPVPVNRDGHPVAVAESLALGAEVSEGGAEGRADVSLAGVLRAWGPWTVGIPVGLGCLLAGFFALRGRRGARSSGPLLLVAFASGLFGMAVEVSLLAAYQNVRGYVYGEIGGIIACFMAGLALGAGWGERCRARPRRVLWRALAGALVFTLALPLAVDGLAWCPGLLAASGFWVLVFIAGFLDGIVFPPLVRCGASGSPEALSSAEGGPDGAEAREAHFGGRAYAWDLAGAALGALLCGAVWIPLFSLPGAMWAVSGVLLAALLALSSVPSADRT
jgi:spermidine synthase